MTLRPTSARLIEVSLARHERYYADGRPRWRDIDWVVAIGGEVGEVLNVVKKLNRDAAGMRGNVDGRPELLMALGAELADVVIYAVIAAGLIQGRVPWRDFADLRTQARRQRDPALSGSLSAMAVELLWWAGIMAVTDGTREILTARQIEGLVVAAADLADAAGIDLGAAVVAKFNATSAKLGFPERL